ncbi:hypothetical protein [Mesomycoplasma ovipneumoniae]|uniref:hypothetical protein n=1 Tax=Mesomycoplasma ovipneumoniae TaxID=29562 RepID=UPI00311AE25D
MSAPRLRINETIASTIEENHRRTTKSLTKLMIFHLSINCLVVQSLPIEILSLSGLVINTIEVIKGINLKPFKYCLTSNPDCLKTSSFLKFQTKMIRKANDKTNEPINIRSNVLFGLPGVVESAPVVGLPSTPLIPLKIIIAIKIIVLKIDNKKSNINFMELS